MKKTVSIIIVAAAGFVLLYISRFWIFELWDRPGLFDLKELPPQGGLFARWIRGTNFAPFELILWTIGGFLALTGLEKLFSIFKRKEKTE